MILHLKPGIENSMSREVRDEHVASRYGSDQLPVLPTSEIVSFMELTAQSSVQIALPEGYSTVGAEIHLKHIRPVSTGAVLTCHSRLTEINGRNLYFEISLRNGSDLVASASHIRAVVSNDSFLRTLKTGS
jgi:fluoroacetyl-CoA thioesterase